MVKDEVDSDGEGSATTVYSRRALASILVLLGCIALVGWNTESFVSEENKMTPQETVAQIQELTDSEPSLFRPELCVEPDEGNASLTPEVISSCECTDPALPLPRSFHGDWVKHHWRLAQQVYQPHYNNSLDFAMVGDSLIERWNGTQALGKKGRPAMREAFESFFTKAGGGTLEGIALGASADTSRNLHWHLSHGMTPSKTFFPKVWLILVGTNDLGQKHCSNQSTVDGILQVAKYIQYRRPQAQILIHGLLPRGEGPQDPMRLGTRWKRIQWINQQLQLECHSRQKWQYMDSGDVFLTSDPAKLSKRIGDGVHPRVSGMKAWGHKIVEAVHAILSSSGEVEDSLE